MCTSFRRRKRRLILVMIGQSYFRLFRASLAMCLLFSDLCQLCAIFICLLLPPPSCPSPTQTHPHTRQRTPPPLRVFFLFFFTPTVNAPDASNASKFSFPPYSSSTAQEARINSLIVEPYVCT